MTASPCNDLVSYNDKHNEANGEDNRDGHSDNRSYNYGAEGPTDDAGIKAVRERQKRNLLATLLLSHGTPMVLGGDEFGRTQDGNNNAYCQDNAINWFDWEDDRRRGQGPRRFPPQAHLVPPRAADPAPRELPRRPHHLLAQPRRRRADRRGMGRCRRQHHRPAPLLSGRAEKLSALAAKC